MIVFNKILIFYVRMCYVIRFILLICYNIINGEYMIIIRKYFDKYSFYIILLRVWVIDLIYLFLLLENGVKNKNNYF